MLSWLKKHKHKKTEASSSSANTAETKSRTASHGGEDYGKQYGPTKQQAVAFLMGWHYRAGAHSVMTLASFGVPMSVARLVVEFLLGSICVYRRGNWRTIGDGLIVIDDTPQWGTVDDYSCGDSVGGRLAWLEPSLQELSGQSDKVYWAFDVVEFQPGACQEGIGASTTLVGMVLDCASSVGGDYYPITYPSLSKRGVKSFGLSLTRAVETRVQGAAVTGLRVTDVTPVTTSDQFSFLLTFESPDKQRGHVDVFRNMKPLVSYDNVDTSMPMYPAVSMCCRPSAYKFVMGPTLPCGV
ncbi:hypothetical protein Pelo_4887 [Pelomyxa schiedti]|nr:hypothetical protein Pelo_4887 [Pelomyxa schiedti]